jgi:hypothetical protein
MVRNTFIKLRVSEQEFADYRALAEHRGESLSEIIRNRLDRLVAARHATMSADAEQ